MVHSECVALTVEHYNWNICLKTQAIVCYASSRESHVENPSGQIEQIADLHAKDST